MFALQISKPLGTYMPIDVVCLHKSSNVNISLRYGTKLLFLSLLDTPGKRLVKYTVLVVRGGRWRVGAKDNTVIRGQVQAECMLHGTKRGTCCAKGWNSAVKEGCLPLHGW